MRFGVVFLPPQRLDLVPNSDSEGANGSGNLIDVKMGTESPTYWTRPVLILSYDNGSHPANLLPRYPTKGGGLALPQSGGLIVFTPKLTT